MNVEEEQPFKITTIEDSTEDFGITQSPRFDEEKKAKRKFASRSRSKKRLANLSKTRIGLHNSNGDSPVNKVLCPSMKLKDIKKSSKLTRVNSKD